MEEENKTNKEGEVDALKAKIAELENLVRQTADKGRLFNYDAARAERKPLRVKLSAYGGGIIVGWRTLKDELIKDPNTGRTIGESQEYEVLVDKNGETIPVQIKGYPAFSDARYTNRVEAEVVGKKEEYDGRTTFDVRLPDGRVIPLDSRFVN